MKSRIVVLVIAAMFSFGVSAQVKPTGKGEGLRVMNTKERVESALRNFLAGVDKPEAHDRFWSNDLVYTSAAGKVRTKAEIMKSVKEEAIKAFDANEPKTTYDSEDVIVHDFGSFAVLNFRLVARSTKDGKSETNYYRNTGTFRLENGEWKVVAWQSTKIDQK